MKKIAVIILSLLCVSLFSQEIDKTPFLKNKKTDLRSLLETISKRFDTPIDFSEVNPQDSVQNGLYQIRPWSIEESLSYALYKSKYIFSHSGNGFIVRKPSRFSRWYPDEGQKLVDYLSSLYSNRASWEERRDSLRRDIRRYTGMDAIPEHYSGKVFLSKARRYKDYYVQNIGLEIMPGLYCTGSVYHPRNISGRKCPIIVNPHGHYEHGRYQDLVQIRCAMQARMGCIAITYDMFAYGDQPMFDPSLHKTAIAQTYQVLCASRVLDYMLSLPEADSTRVAITGSSGGASQAIFAASIDDRYTVMIPAVMLSSYMIGGCPCESGSSIHLGGGYTNNLEIASLFAPKPMLVISDGKDWTFMTPDVEMPYLKRIYRFYDAENNITNVHFEDEGHDYGYSKRQAMYKFLIEQFSLEVSHLLDKSGELDESWCVVEPSALLMPWGPDKKDWPSDAISDPAELARILNWSKIKP